MKKQPTLAQQIKKELKANFPELKVSCTGGHDPKVWLLNLHSTNYSYDQVDDFCSQYRKIQRCEATGEILLGAYYVPVKDDISEEFKAELRDMFIDYHNSHVDEKHHLKQGEWFCYYDVYTRYDEWSDLLDNKCYCNLSDKADYVFMEESQETEGIETEETEIEQIENLVSEPKTDIKAEIFFTEEEIDKITDLLEYLDENDINGDIYDTAHETLDNLYQKLKNLESQLDPTVEIKKEININNLELQALSVKLTQAVTESNLEAVTQIQQEIANTVEEIKLLQAKLDTLSQPTNLIHLFG